MGQQVAATTSVVNCRQQISQFHVTEWQQAAATAGSMIDVGQSGKIFIGDR